VLGADVGGEDRRPHHPPAEVATGEKVVVRGVAVLPDRPPCDAADEADTAGFTDQGMIGQCVEAELEHGRRRADLADDVEAFVDLEGLDGDGTGQERPPHGGGSQDQAANGPPAAPELRIGRPMRQVRRQRREIGEQKAT
jgi:hypothetical protein